CKSVVYDFGGSNPPPSTKYKTLRMKCLSICGGFESRLLRTVRWTVRTGVALPQQSESTTFHQIQERTENGAFFLFCPSILF
ncbi:hypothetical protein, partial [Agathobaculum hominis]